MILLYPENKKPIMPDIIRLLSDSVANQIAAGEVIQRPASAVKELLENAIDSGATEIKLIIKEAGKLLVQVIDNGCGMSETDARMSFDRHATSKIREANDLFAIRTLGFRGEALASIAAIAQVELKSRRYNDDIGTEILIEGSEIKSQQSCQCSEGTSFAVKNLFFNVPARRHFLKSDKVETGHILDEFHRVALPNPDVIFTLHNNNNEVYHLEKNSLKQRIMALFGAALNQKLLPLELKTELVTISGFIGKPDAARKTRGEQFFFVNNRFIKHAYLNHSVVAAYEEMIQANSFPSYFIFLETDPKNIDINIHPTKTEIKFQDERYIYTVMRTAIKQALGKFSITPSIDFEIEGSFNNIPPLSSERVIQAPQIKINPDYNPFETNKISGSKGGFPTKNKSNLENWDKLYPRHADNQMEFTLPESQQMKTIPDDEQETPEVSSNRNIFQYQGRYILSMIKSGILILDQQAAHERILYEKLMMRQSKSASSTQQHLFPVTLELSAADAEIFQELLEDINSLGFDISSLGKNTFVVNGVPTEVASYNVNELMEELVENFKNSPAEIKLDKANAIALSMAKNTAVKHGKALQPEEMNHIIDELFACSVPQTSPSGKPTLTILSTEEIEKRFK